jgi:hypothetical protein
MKALSLATFIGAIISSSLVAEEKEPEDYFKDFPESYHKVVKDGKGTTIEVLLELQKFDWKAHKVEYNTNNYDGEWRPANPHSPHPFRVDGENALGTDAGVPGHELKTFRIIWDGKPIKVPASLWRDCFNLALWTPAQLQDKAHQERWAATYSVLSESRRCLMIVSYGGGGAGSYKVIWTIQRDGRCERFFESLEEGDRDQ